MAVIEVANVSRLLSVYNKSTDNFICTPFFSKNGLALVRQKSNYFKCIDFITRGNVYDWVHGYADLVSLSAFLQDIENAGVTARLFISGKLHAKIYASPSSLRAYLGSANLSTSGFVTNFEIMTYLEGEECKPALDIIDKHMKTTAEISITDFVTLVELCREDVERVKVNIEKKDLEEDESFIAAVQLVSEELQNKVKPRETKESIPGKISPDKVGNLGQLDKSLIGIEEFIEYCEGLDDKSAKEIVSRYHGESNLQGHIKHMFYGCLFFFFEHPDEVKEIPSDLIERDRVRWLDEAWTEPWKKYLNFHANEFYKDIEFNYHTLITYLPTTLGGIQSSGGASSGNFKKVIFYLSKMIRENYK